MDERRESDERSAGRADELDRRERVADQRDDETDVRDIVADERERSDDVRERVLDRSERELTTRASPSTCSKGRTGSSWTPSVPGGARSEAMERALDSRDQIAQAKGILMEQREVTADEAYRLLRVVSQATNRKVLDVAAHVVTQRRLPEPPTRHEP